MEIITYLESAHNFDKNVEYELTDDIILDIIGKFKINKVKLGLHLKSLKSVIYTKKRINQKYRFFIIILSDLNVPNGFHINLEGIRSSLISHLTRELTHHIIKIVNSSLDTSIRTFISNTDANIDISADIDNLSDNLNDEIHAEIDSKINIPSSVVKLQFKKESKSETKKESKVIPLGPDDKLIKFDPNDPELYRIYFDLLSCKEVVLEPEFTGGEKEFQKYKEEYFDMYNDATEHDNEFDKIKFIKVYAVLINKLNKDHSPYENYVKSKIMNMYIKNR